MNLLELGLMFALVGVGLLLASVAVAIVIMAAKGDFNKKGENNEQQS